MLRYVSSALPLSAILLLNSSCDSVSHISTGPPRTESVQVDRLQAERANLELNIGAGELRMDGGGGASSLVSGNIEYVPDLKPQIVTVNGGTHAVITIRQPSQHTVVAGSVNKSSWNLHLGPSVMWDLSINCGAGQAELDLGKLDLRSLDIHIGVGQVDLDLQGVPKRDYDVNINGGIGQATVNLPKDVGIWAEASGGLGNIEVSGLQKEGNHYQNDLYEKSKVNIHVKVAGGIGEIRLIG